MWSLELAVNMLIVCPWLPDVPELPEWLWLPPEPVDPDMLPE